MFFPYKKGKYLKFFPIKRENYRFQAGIDF